MFLAGTRSEPFTGHSQEGVVGEGRLPLAENAGVKSIDLE